MIYGGNMMSNFSGGILSNDKDMTKDVVLSEVHKILDKSPEVLIETLNSSGQAVSKNVSKKDLVHLTVENLYENPKFRENISALIIAGNETNYYNSDGDVMDKLKGLFNKGGGGADAGSGGSAPKVTVGADPISAIAGAIGSIFSFAQSGKDRKAAKEADKRKLQVALLGGDDKKTNWLPIVLIGGILLIGGAVAYVSLKNK
jgi:fructose-1,6-bisphosphatase/sedoheptulose 1,7-bisphosphatase-like protein